MFVLGRVGRQFSRQAFSQTPVSHGTVFLPGDFLFLLDLPRSVSYKICLVSHSNLMEEVEPEL